MMMKIHTQDMKMFLCFFITALDTTKQPKFNLQVDLIEIFWTSGPCATVALLAILSGLGWEQHKYLLCPTQLFCQTTGFLAQAQSGALFVCVAGMIVHLHVAEGRLSHTVHATFRLPKI